MKENEEGALYIYRKEKRVEDEAMPLSETGPTEGRHVFWALNASRDEELTDDFPASLDPKK